MDKYEYKLRSDEIVKLIEEEKYVEAANIADMIDWRRVKSITIRQYYRLHTNVILRTGRFCTLCVKCRLSWMM